MGHTNSTANLALPQFIGTDKPTWLSDVNGAFAAIDTYAGNNDAALAITDAKADTAIGNAASAVTTAGNAATTAGNAAATATAANTVAGNALTVANGINSKVGVLTDLHTTDKSTVVNAINEVFDAQAAPTAAEVSYDNTGSGLTATDVQAAIDEIAGGSAGWQSVATVTGTADITEPANYTEAMIVINTNNDNLAVFTQNFPKAVLVNGMQFRGGNDQGGYIFKYTAGKFNLQDIVISGTNYTAATTTTLYYR